MLQAVPGAMFEASPLTPTRLYLKVVTEQVEAEIVPGDVVKAGVVISNSEVGQGSLSVQPLVYRLVCRNGLIMPDFAMRKMHIGRQQESSWEEVAVFKDDTLQADDMAFFLKVRDVVQTCVSEATLQLIAAKMRNTLGIHLTGNLVKTVEVLATRYMLNEPERDGVLRHLIEGGDLSGYGLINAVTGFSQEVENYDRATELEVMGGRLVDQTQAQWSELATA